MEFRHCAVKVRYILIRCFCLSCVYSNEALEREERVQCLDRIAANRIEKWARGGGGRLPVARAI